MIGSHDSYSYLNSTSSVLNSFSRFWRCQNKSITEQYKKGVRYFDVRVAKEDKDNGKYVWRVCHGKADFSKVFSNMKSLCNYFKTSLPESKIRIVLEKGDDDDIKLFKQQTLALVEDYPCVMSLAIKDPWEGFYYRKGHPEFVDYSYKDWDFMTIATHCLTSVIKNHAQEVNPEITDEMTNDQTKIYFMDYATREY